MLALTVGRSQGGLPASTKIRIQVRGVLHRKDLWDRGELAQNTITTPQPRMIFAKALRNRKRGKGNIDIPGSR